MADPTDPATEPWMPFWLPFSDQLAPAPDAPAPDAPLDPSASAEPSPPIALVPGLGLPASLFDPAAQQVLHANFPNEPVTHPDGADLEAPGPVLHPDFAPAFTGQDQTPITTPAELAGAQAPTTPSEVSAAAAPAAPASPAEPYVDDPLANPDEAAGQRQLAQMAATDPARFIAYSNDWQEKRARDFAQHAIDVEEANRRKAEQDLQDRQEAEAATTKKMAALDVQAQELASRKIDTNRWWGSRTTGQRVWSYIGAIAGGLAAGMKGSDGRNQFLDQMQHTIDEDIDAQKADIENGRAGLNVRRGILSDEFARTGNLYQAAEATRLASYGAALKELQARQQLYDPRGTTAMSYAQQINDWQGRMAASRQATAEKQLKQEIDIREQLRKEASDAETMRHNMATEANARIKKGGVSAGVPGAAIGKPPDPAFPFATGYYVDGQTVWSRRQIGGKGEDPKERDEVNTTLREYQHVNDQLIKMKRIAQELGGGGKGWGEALWSKRKTTLGADYDAAREAAISFMTKAIGDRPTQGQLELQAHRLPERQDFLSAQDPVALIDAQLEEADRSVIGDLGTIGVDPTPVLESGKRKRVAAPPPAIVDEVAAAQEAKAKAKPGTAAYRDATADLDAANARREDNIKQKAADKQNVGVQTALARGGGGETNLDTQGLPTSVRAQVNSHNQAVEALERERAKLLEIEKNKPKPTGKKGTDLQVGGDYEASVARQASKVRDADRAVFNAKNDTLRTALDHLDQLPSEKQTAIDELATKYGAPPVEVLGLRKAWMIHAATDENAKVSPKFREGLLELLGGGA